MTKTFIGFAGMTHLGIVSSICAAEKNFNVICYDNDKNLIKDLNSNKTYVSEPHLNNLIKKNNKKILFTSEINKLKKCDLLYISPDVPTNNKGESDLTSIKVTFESISKIADAKTPIVILSQVPPGFTRKIFIKNRPIYYQVETLIFGQAVQRALFPERLIIGCHNPDLPLHHTLQKFLNSYKCPIIKMGYESAELTKISINMFLISSISTTNKLAEVCENIGASWLEIAPALMLDKRIGKHAYLSPGLGLAGGNLERDLSTIYNISNEHKIDTKIITSWQQNSAHRLEWAFKTLYNELIKDNPKAVLGILGLAYKPNTHSIKNSPSIYLIKKLKRFKLKIFDPVVKLIKENKQNYFVKLSEVDAYEGVDALIIMTAWPQFKKISLKNLKNKMKGKIIIDPFKILNGTDCKKNGFKYFTLGEPSI